MVLNLELGNHFYEANLNARFSTNLIKRQLLLRSFNLHFEPKQKWQRNIIKVFYMWLSREKELSNIHWIKWKNVLIEFLVKSLNELKAKAWRPSRIKMCFFVNSCLRSRSKGFTPWNTQKYLQRRFYKKKLSMYNKIRICYAIYSKSLFVNFPFSNPASDYPEKYR